MQAGTIVQAIWDEDKRYFGKLLNTEVYRVGGIVRGNDGEVKNVRLVGVQGYWPADKFKEVPAEMLEELKKKAAEVAQAGVKLPRSIVNALGEVVENG